MFEIDLEHFKLCCDDAGLTARIVPSNAGAHHCIGIEGDHRDLITFMLTVAPRLDDHFELLSTGELDYRREWHNLQVAPEGPWFMFSWPMVRPVRGLRPELFELVSGPGRS